MSTVYVVYSKETIGDIFKLVGIYTDPDSAKMLCKKDCDNEWIEVELDKEVNEYI